MRIFIYEHITGGGLLESDDCLLASLRPEGEQMLMAVATDFSAVDGTHVFTLRDTRLAGMPPPCCARSCQQDTHNLVTWGVHSSCEAKTIFDRFVQEADWTLLIAPETNEILTGLAKKVHALGGRLLSPGMDFIALTSNKIDTARKLVMSGIPTPISLPIEVQAGVAEIPLDFPYPAIVKPVDGAGSMGIQCLAHPNIAGEPEVSASSTTNQPAHTGRSPEVLLEPLSDHIAWMIEQLCPGTPASVALLCGPDGCLPLPPFQQHLEPETFRFLGGSRVMDARRAARATDLAVHAVEALGRPTGYIGVDLILGDDPTGADDYVIEINPRLTTSYIGLRTLTDDNLANAMLSTATGQPTALSFRDEALEFAVA